MRYKGRNKIRIRTSSLPNTSSENWGVKRKVKVLEEITKNNMTDEQVFEKWGITRQEKEEWQERFTKGGKKGLRITYATEYRRKKTTALDDYFV